VRYGAREQVVSGSYYNEFDPHAAAWLRELIKAGEIAPGDVDERSIIDVDPADLLGYTQHHFFAGIGGWSRALRLAGIPDSEPIVTGSCPCQPFSSAGKGEGLNDARHLWPHFFRIISALRPARVVGEQVASPAALVWWDAVCADLEGAGYAGWAADLCSAGAGGDHIRQRLYWVADACCDGHPSTKIGRKVGASKNACGVLKPQRRTTETIVCRDGKRRAYQSGAAPWVAKLPADVVRSGYQGMAIDAMNSPEAASMRLKGYGNAIDPELAAMFLRVVSS
jgi:DNA (cytosine-5)-methyltransferase 1